MAIDKSTQLNVYEGVVEIYNPMQKATGPITKIEAPREVKKPGYIEGPKEVSLDEWTYIVKDMQRFTITPSGLKKVEEFKKDDMDEQSDWIKWNMEMDKRWIRRATCLSFLFTTPLHLILLRFYRDLGVLNLMSKSVSFLVAILSLYIFTYTAWAEDTIAKIAIKGNLAIEADAIKAVIKISEGKPLITEDVRDAIKAIFEMGYFTDVQAETSDTEGGRI